MTTRSLAIFSLAAVIALAPLFTHVALWQPRDEARDEKRPTASARFLLIGSGFDARSTEKQIEQDIALAQETLRRGAPNEALITLFAAGPNTIGVRALSEIEAFDERMLLGWLFGGELLAGHDLLVPEIEVDYAATPENFEAILAADAADPQLELFFFAGHGERRERIAQSFFTLSGGARMSVAELATLLDEYPAHKERLFIHSACYSGAFGEMIFEGGDASLGLSEALRCGLFASSADDPATGCSADGDREGQDGFSLYFFNALRGLDRDGERPVVADLDGDGEVSALEAHAIARAHAETIDVPTTSSERALRYFAELREAEAGEIEEREIENDEEITELPEDPIERYVIAALAASLGISSFEAAAIELERVESAIAALDAVIDEANDELRQEASALEAKILQINPYLSDAWDARFEGAFAKHRSEIKELLISEEADGIYAAIELVELVQNEQQPALIRRAKLKRLLRAYENLRLARELRPEEQGVYRALRRCEARSPFSPRRAP